jgi:hypothetical protein
MKPYQLALLLLLVLPATLWAGQPLRLGPADVWTLPMDAWSDCLATQHDPTACLARIMEQSKASPGALSLLSQLDGEAFMSAFEDMGRVDLATMTFPARANTNEVPYLVNGNPALVSTELDTQRITISSDPLYPKLKAAFPQLELWPSSAEFRAMDLLSDGGQRFVFAYPLLNGCHACELGGYALVAHDFGPDGSYLGARLLHLEPGR